MISKSYIRLLIFIQKNINKGKTKIAATKTPAPYLRNMVGTFWISQQYFATLINSITKNIISTYWKWVLIVTDWYPEPIRVETSDVLYGKCRRGPMPWQFCHWFVVLHSSCHLRLIEYGWVISANIKKGKSNRRSKKKKKNEFITMLIQKV